MYVSARQCTCATKEARVRKGDAVEEAGGKALRCSLIFHTSLGRMSTLKIILNTIITLRLVLINIALTWVLYYFF